MRVILFQDRFQSKILNGSKKNTIRKTAFRCKPGDTLSLRRWTGKPYRSKQEIIVNTECSAVSTVYLNYDKVVLNNNLLSKSLMDKFATNDGFEDYSDMAAWFKKTHGLPFYGYLIGWR